MSFEAHQKNIGKLLNDSIYRIPRNQRPYVWEERNWSELFRDLRIVASSNSADNDTATHFIGSIVLKQEESEAGLDIYTIIDGQQRVLTLTLLLASICFFLKKNGCIADTEGTKKYLIACDNKGHDVNIVDPENNPSLPSIVSRIFEMQPNEAKEVSARKLAKMCSSGSQGDEKIFSAFNFFSKELAVLEVCEVLRFRDALLQTQYVDISSSIEEDLYTVFEILNARGLPLNDGDLLKNFIMRYIHPRAYRDDAKAAWKDIESQVGTAMDSFLRHYAIQSCRFTSRDSGGVYAKIHDYTDPTKVKDLLHDLRKKANYYSRMLRPRPEQPDSIYLSFFKTHRVQLFRPLIMSLMGLQENEDITYEEYLDSMKFIFNFYICYKVIGGLESNQLTNSIAKYSFSLEKQFRGIETLLDWKKSFLEKLPEEESFTRQFVALGWSHHHGAFSDNRKKEQCKVVLEMLELNKCPTNQLGEYTIEHILPDSSGEENAQIGNLVLLEKNLNEKCGDKNFADKIPYLRDSRFAITRGVAARYQNKPFNPAKRGEYLAKTVYSLITSELTEGAR